ncbi:hypothetical protein GR160_10375 [Flavobacterium sp. Sd200]|uniref:hypothetical protein n=1 Tax=Flavobacterium sp. Sd200 TaxID=2692211 RepID=UPI00136C2561|nr:hypothetical protein [Flavobacterium sp. Sd200]MXN91632.1 hypothetical protein [Flavobacterium sp. Sd200]
MEPKPTAEEVQTATIANTETEIIVLETTATTTLPPPSNSNEWTEYQFIKAVLKKTNNNRIDVFIELMVKNHFGNDNKKYAFAGPPLLIKYDGHYALVFRYNNIDNLRDAAAEIPMSVSFNLENRYEWDVDQKVRIMAINEKSANTFLSLTPYYVYRIEKNPDNHISSDSLTALNQQWNKYNSEIIIDPYTYTPENEECESFGKKGILTPKLAKGDLILKVK